VELIDTHCHPVLLEERGVLEQAWESCRANSVVQLVAVGLNLEDSRKNQAVAKANPGVFFTVGWHPQEKRAPNEDELVALDALLDDPRAVAVGEVGLDLFFRPGYHETNLEIQQASLESMMDLAKAHRKPVVIHTRDAHEEILSVMARWPDVRGVMHCFSGDPRFAARCLDLGYVLSFSGIATFKSAKDIQGAAQSVGADDFMVETDSPFLAPVPHRGELNLPGFVIHTAQAVADLRGETLEDVATQSTATARRIFGLTPEDTL
jgi:TatD DNase family protein